MKTLPHAPDGFFEAEAAGLRWLAEVDGGVPVPEVLAVDERLPDPALGRAGPKTPAEAAVDLRPAARRHPRRRRRRRAGLDHDGFIGRLPLPNKTGRPWAEFYAVRRVLPYLKLARDRGAITDDDAAAVEAVDRPAHRPGPRGAAGPAARRPLERQRASGATTAAIRVIDPAAYGGHREVDLAMLRLFGLPHLPRVLDAVRRGAPARRRLGGPARRCTSSSRCSCTPACSAAATAPAPADDRGALRLSERGPVASPFSAPTQARLAAVAP